MTHPIVSDGGYVASDVEALLAAMEDASPGRESEAMRLLLARVTLDNGALQFQGLCDVDGNIWEANYAALAGAGIVRSEVHGKPLWQAGWWRSSEEAQRLLEAGIRRAATGEFVRCDAVIGGEGGEQRTVVDVSFRPVADAKGKTRFLVVEGRDVTEQRRLEGEVAEQREQLAEALERFEEADELKSQVLAELALTQERIGRELNESVIKGIFAASLSLHHVLQQTRDPGIIERVTLAIQELDSTIRQVRLAVFGLGDQ